MNLIKNIILISILIFLSTRTTYASCHFDCFLFYSDDSSSHLVASSEEFQKSSHQDSGCRLVKSIKSKIHLFEIYEPVQGEFSMNIKKGRNTLVSSHFNGHFGALTLFDENLRFSCTRSVN